MTDTPDIAKLAAEMRAAVKAGNSQAVLTILDALDTRGRDIEARWHDIASAPKAAKVLVRCGPSIDVAYQTDHGPEMMDTWRHGGTAKQGQQLGYWPTLWTPLPSPPADDVGGER